MATHTLYRELSNVDTRRHTPVLTTITSLDCRDGGSLLVIDQPNLNRSDLSEDDRVALDDAAQERIYKFLKSKFEV